MCQNALTFVARVTKERLKKKVQLPVGVLSMLLPSLPLISRHRLARRVREYRASAHLAMDLSRSPYLGSGGLDHIYEARQTSKEQAKMPRFMLEGP